MTTASIRHDWYLARDGKRYGPISEDQLHHYVQTGYVRRDDLLWRQGFAEWMKAESVDGIFPVEEQAQFLHAEHTTNTTIFVENSAFGNKNTFSDSDTFADNKFEFIAEPLIDRPAIEKASTLSFTPKKQKSLKAEKNQFKFTKKTQPPKETSRFKQVLGKAFLVLCAFFVISGSVIFSVQTFLSADFLSEKIINLVQQKTGRSLIISGNSSFTILPTLGVKFRNVRLSNPPKMTGKPLLEMAELHLELKLIPFLQSQIEIQQIILKQPKVFLYINNKEENNWTLVSLNKERPLQNTQYIPTAQQYSEAQNSAYHYAKELFSTLFLFSKPAVAQEKFSFNDIRLNKIKIIGGEISYQDDRNGLFEELKNMNFVFSTATVTSILYAKGRASWNGEELSFDGNVTTPENIVQKRISPISIDLLSQHFTISLSGKLSLLDGLFFTGDGDFQTASMRDMMNWLGHKVALRGGVNNFSLRGKIEAQAHKLNFKDAQIILDNIQARGQGNILLSGARPYVRAKINAENVDLNAYIEHTARHDKRASSHTAYEKRDHTTLVNYNKEVSLSDQKIPNTTDKNDTFTYKIAEENVSAKPINSFAADLGAFDADIDLTFNEFFYKNLKASQGEMTVEVRDGLLTANIEKFKFYDGNGSGKITLNGTEAIPAFSSVIKLSKVSAEPFLTDAFRVNQFAGNIDLLLNIKGFGHTERQVLSTLNGHGRADFKNGFIKGIDIPKFMRSIKKGKLNGWSLEPDLKTEFDQLSGSFTLEKGIARNKDLKLQVPLTIEQKKNNQTQISHILTTEGTGTVDFVKKWIDYRLLPKISDARKGKKNQKKKFNFVIPVHIEGSIYRPKIIPDLGAIAQNSDAIVSGLKAAQKVLKDMKKKKKLSNDDFETLIQGVLGDKSKQQKKTPETYQLQEQSFQLKQFIQQP